MFMCGSFWLLDGETGHIIVVVIVVIILIIIINPAY